MRPCAAEDLPDPDHVRMLVAQAHALLADDSARQADRVFAKASDEARALGDSALEAGTLEGRFAALERLGDVLGIRAVAERLVAVENVGGDPVRKGRAEARL